MPDPDEAFRRRLDESTLLQRIRNREPDIRRYRKIRDYPAGRLRTRRGTAGSIGPAGSGEPDADGSGGGKPGSGPGPGERDERIVLTRAYELQAHPSLPELPGARIDISA